MNERIKELAEQAGVEFDESFSSEPETIYYLGLSHFEKFAELIVRECADVAKETRWAVPPSQEQIARGIQQHFGVENETQRIQSKD